MLLEHSVGNGRELAKAAGVKSGMPQMYWFDSGGLHLDIAYSQGPSARHFFSNDADIAVQVILRRSNCSASDRKLIGTHYEQEQHDGVLGKEVPNKCNVKKVKYIETWKGKHQ